MPELFNSVLVAFLLWGLPGYGFPQFLGTIGIVPFLVIGQEVETSNISRADKVLVRRLRHHVFELLGDLISLRALAEPVRIHAGSSRQNFLPDEGSRNQ